MAAEILVIDPTSELATNSPLTLTSDPYGLLEHHYPQPPIDPQWASSASTEGEALAANRHQNREVSITVDVNTLAGVRSLQLKLGKLFREGGTLQRTMSDATVRTFDILTVDGYDPTFDQTWHLGGITSTSFTLRCRPYARGTEQTLTLHTEATLPAISWTETGIQGDVAALGRLVVSDTQAQDQWWVVWGLESRYYQSAASAALFWQAEALTALSGSAIAAGTGASGAGSNVMRNTTLAATYQAVLSTTSAASVPMTHAGSFRVFTRAMAPATNSGSVSLAFEWTRSDFRATAQNSSTTLDSDWRGLWQIVDLGVVTLPAGTPYWEGRIIARSTKTGDDLDLDWLLLCPVDEGSGEATALVTTNSPSAISVRDDFSSGSIGANLNGAALLVGAGTWTTSGATPDFLSFNIEAKRENSVADTGRFAIAGTTSLTNVDASIDMSVSTLTHDASQALLTRYVDATNFVIVQRFAATGLLTITRVVANVWTQMAATTIASAVDTGWYTVKVRIDTQGRYWVWLYSQGGAAGLPVMSGYDSVLATGGTLASGKTGIYDQNLSGGGLLTRLYENFLAFVPIGDAAIFASQSLEIRSDSVLRENSAGTSLQPVSSYAGDYLRIPPAGAEGRTSRFIVKASRNNPDLAPDTGIDDITAQLFYTPRFLAV